MTALTHIVALIHRMQVQAQAQRSLGAVLLRADDRLLDDIGLNRHDATLILRNRLAGLAPYAGQIRMTASFTPAAAIGAGSCR